MSPRTENVSMEDASAKRSRRQNLQDIVLTTVAISGGLAVAAVAPNALSAMNKLGLIPKPRQKESIRSAQRLLQQKGLVHVVSGTVQVTPKGKKYLEKIEVRTPVIKPKRWDKKWRVLIFDIPERRRSVRDHVRHMLVHIGFIRLQDSVWIYPYPCEKVVALLKADIHIGKDLLYMIVDDLENDRTLRIHFELPIR